MKELVIKLQEQVHELRDHFDYEINNSIESFRDLLNWSTESGFSRVDAIEKTLANANHSITELYKKMLRLVDLVVIISDRIRAQEDEICNIADIVERNTLLAAKNVLTPDDVVQLTGMSKSCLYKLTSTRKITHYKPNGKMVYFNREELEKWLQSNRVATDEELERQAEKMCRRKRNKKPARRV